MNHFNYTKTPLSVDRLSLEIRNSSISIALDHISVFGNDIDIYFKADLSPEEVICLTDIVSNHDGQPLPENKIVEISGTVTPTSPSNDYCMQPYGTVKGHLLSSDKACSITLSNKSQDGVTFNYSSAIVPTLGNYVFQKNFTKRSWISAIDLNNQTITFANDDDCDALDEGIGHYSSGEWIDCKVTTWYPSTYLWGAIIRVLWSKSNIIDDFMELSIIDHCDLFKTDEYCQAVFGCNASEVDPILVSMGFEFSDEYGHWTKYYDQSWVMTCNGKDMKTPDGAPGQIPAGLYLRISYFTSVTDDTQTDVYIDYYPTNK